MLIRLMHFHGSALRGRGASYSSAYVCASESAAMPSSERKLEIVPVAGVSIEQLGGTAQVVDVLEALENDLDADEALS